MHLRRLGPIVLPLGLAVMFAGARAETALPSSKQNFPDNAVGEITVEAVPGEIVDRDGFTDKQVNALKAAGVRRFAVPSRLPKHVRLKSTRIKREAGKVLCVVLTYTGRRADALFTYTSGRSPECLATGWPLSFKSPDPSRFIPDADSAGESGPGDKAPLAPVAAFAPAFGKFLLTPLGGCYSATPIDTDQNRYRIDGLCAAWLQPREIVTIVSSSRIRQF